MLGYVYDLDWRLLMLFESQGQPRLRIFVRERACQYQVVFHGERHVEDGEPVMIYRPESQ